MAEAKERLPRELIAMRVAAELTEGQFVNLGIGIPNLVSDFTPTEKHIMFHAENGILGVGRNQEVGKIEVPEMMNAGGQPVHMVPGGWRHSSPSRSLGRDWGPAFLQRTIGRLSNTCAAPTECCSSPMRS